LTRSRQKIVDYREQHGAFTSVDDLDAIPGIGPARLEFFVQPVVDCNFVATVESTAVSATATVQGASGAPTRVSVFTFDPLNLADRQFHLAVFC
jgi:hypothetical protein